MNRRTFLMTGLGAAPLALSRRSIARTEAERAEDLVRAMNRPVLRKELLPGPVKLEAIDLLKNERHFLVRARSTEGAVGIAEGNSSVLRSAYPIMIQRVIPHFLGRDARDLEDLVRGAYLQNSNYKWQGLPFWVCVASVELAVLDLLGRVAGKPLGELVGDIVRRDISVYRASGNRGNSPEKEIEYLQKLVQETGAQAIKFRLGARMRYDDASTRRDLALIPLTRKVFGDGMTIYADANGSYDVPMAIRIGRIMEESKLRFFEEPVPFDHYDETREVASSLSIPIAGGEQESSLRRFRSMIENKTVRIVQPDIFYFGGMIRSVQVARMAEAAGMDCTLHMSGGGLGYLYVVHFASFVANAGPHQEYKGEDEDLPVSSDTSPLKSVDGRIRVPSGPGLGVTIDPDFVAKARPVAA